MCPRAPRIDDKLAVVSGASGGMGVDIARGLGTRGAELVLPCRNLEKGARVADELRRIEPSPNVHLVKMDLEDLGSIDSGAREIIGLADGRPIDVFVENAGIWPRIYAETKQGHEIAFGVNVLAHFALRRRLMSEGLLDDSRVVSVTEDIYILESECTPDYRWRGAYGGMKAYCRSKLGNLWQASELARRYPRINAFAVHPGVVATDLGGSLERIGSRVRRSLMITPQLGSQMALICATQHKLRSGGYYHNARGSMKLADADPGRDVEGAAALWNVCEELASY